MSSSQTNLIVIKTGCPHCREAMKVIDPLNLRLPIQKRIKVYDNYLWEAFGVDVHPIAKKLSDDGFDAYPYIRLMGAEIEPAQKELLKPFLEKFFEKDLLF